MRIVMLSLFLLALASAQPPAPTLTIQGPTRADPYKLIELVATGKTEGRYFIWSVTPEEHADVKEIAGGTLVFVGPPGTYKVKLHAIRTLDGVISGEVARHTVVIGSPPASKQPPPPGGTTIPPGEANRIDPLRALSKIVFPASKAGWVNTCTATVVHPQLPDGRWEILSATHCIEKPGERGTLTTKDGQTIAVRVAQYRNGGYALDRTCDICWLITEQPVNGLWSAVLARENPPVGTPVWQCGYGDASPEITEQGYVKRIEDSTGMLTFRLPVDKGDSGGGIFRADTGELVAAVHGVPALAPRLETYAGSCRQAWRLRPSTQGGRPSEFIPRPPPRPGEGRTPWTPDCPDGRCPIR